MAQIHRTRTLTADPSDIWNVLADFGAIGQWAGNVDHSCILNHGVGGEMVGTTRRVQVGRDALVERITEFDPPHALGYDIEGLPPRLRHVANRWTLQPTGMATIVTLTSTVEIASGPIPHLAERVLCRIMARQSDAMLTGLSDRLETARV